MLFQGSSNEILRRVTRGKLRVTQASVGSAQHDANVHVGTSCLQFSVSRLLAAAVSLLLMPAHLQLSALSSSPL